VLFPAAGLVAPVYPADTPDPADPAETPDPADPAETPDPADTPDASGGVAVADAAVGAELVAACWLRWKAAGEAGGSGEVAMVSVGVDQESRSSTQREAVVGNCRSVSGIVF
jgi:hypothetical protein